MTKALTFITGCALLAAGLVGCAPAEPLAPDQDPAQVLQQQGAADPAAPAITEAPPMEPVTQ